MNLFNILFGWRKASKCKKLIRRVQCRLKILKNKRDSMIRHLREDIVQLLKNGQEECALRRVEVLSTDQCIMNAYDSLDHFCELIIINLPYIWRNKDCPNDINEAASTLLYASARCGDLPELNKLRKLFGERYGQRFAMAAVELLPGNLVNRQVIEKLSVKSISYDEKFRLMKEISRENGLVLDPPDTVSRLDPSYEPGIVQGRIPSQSSSGTSSTSRLSSSSLQHKMETSTVTSENSIQLSEQNIVYLDDIEEFQPSTQEDSNYNDQRLFVFKPTIPPPAKDIEDDRAGLSELHHDIYSDDRTEPSPTSDGKTSSRSTNKRRKSSRKRRSLYLENQRSRSPASVSSTIKDTGCVLYYSDSRHHRRKNQKIMSIGKSTRRRSYTSHENKLTSTPQWCKEQKLSKEICCQVRGKNHLSHETKCQRRGKTSCCGVNCDMNAECSLEHPCYFITSDDKDDWGSPSPRQMSGNTKSLQPPYRKLQEVVSTKKRSLNSTEKSEITNSRAKGAKNKATSNDMKHKDMGSVSRSHKSRRDYGGTYATHEVVVSQKQRQYEQRMDVEEEQVSDCQQSYVSSRGSCTREVSPWTQKTRPPYLKAATMPPERPKETPTDQFLWSASFQYPQHDDSNSNSSSSSSCRHIHPRLPDYDEFKSKFAALKKEH